jgi:hypothetical protein
MKTTRRAVAIDCGLELSQVEGCGHAADRVELRHQTVLENLDRAAARQTRCREAAGGAELTSECDPQFLESLKSEALRATHDGRC